MTTALPDAAEILARLRARGFTLQVAENGKLQVLPASQLSADDIATIGATKEALKALLVPVIEPVVPPPPAPKTQSPNDGPHSPICIIGDPEANLGLCGPSQSLPTVAGRRPSSLDLPRLVLPETVAAAQDAVRDLMDRYLVGIDTESTGLDPFVNHRILLQLATDDVVYLFDPDVVDWRVLQPLFTSEGPWLCGHNLKYECRVLMAAGLELPVRPKMFDTGIAARSIEATAKKPAPLYGLEDIALRYCGIYLDKGAQLTFRHGPKSTLQLEYAARDALVCLPLTRVLLERLGREGLSRIGKLEMAAICAVAWLEHNGVPVDEEGWLWQAEAMEAQRRALHEQLTALSGEQINWNAPQQVARVLQARGHTLLLTAGSHPLTGKPALFGLPEKEPLRSLLLDDSILKSRTSTYGKKFLRHIHPVTGLVHGDWHQNGSEAGRMSCTTVPLQGIPRLDAYRSLIRVPEGDAIVKADWGHIEFDLAVQQAGDANGIKLLSAGECPHYRTASQLLGVALEKVTKPQRQMAKPVNFGLIYSMGPDRLARYAKESYGLDLPVDTARQWQRKFFRYYQGLRAWHESIPDGPITTRTVLGRLRRDVTVFGEKANTPVQGSGADALKIALGMIWRRRSQVPTARLIIACHDEILLRCPLDDAENVQRFLDGIMRESMSRVLIVVPPVVESGVYRDWGITKI